MKVNFCQKCEDIQPSKNNKDAKTQCLHTPIKQADCDAALCQAVYGKAMLNMKAGKAKPQTSEEIANLLNKIFEEEGMFVSRQFGNSLHIGRPVEGFKKLYYDDVRAKCIKDENGFVTEIYTLDNRNNDVKIYNADGELKKHFFQEDMNALKEYKYNAEEIHAFLRHSKDRFYDDEETLCGWIDTIDSIFNDEQRVWRTEKPMVLYRALQPDLTEAEKDTLSTNGEIYSDKSFVSTSTDYNVACRFRTQENPILEIEVPEGSKYLDMDAMFNIDRQHWKESEYLLPRNSKFLVTGYDILRNVIKVKYLGD